MEEEIEILEELIQFLKSDDVEETFDDFTPEILALENLLKAYKELKEENEKLKENSIPVSKVKEVIEEIDQEKLNYSENEWYLESEIKAYATEKIQELLGEEKEDV